MKLLFVYNIEKSLVSKASEYLGGMLNSRNEDCKLCSLTYDNLGMKKEWKEFVEGLPYPIEFLYKEDFIGKYEEFESEDFPLVVVYEDKPRVLISAEQINPLKSLKDLMSLVSNSLKKKSV